MRGSDCVWNIYNHYIVYICIYIWVYMCIVYTDDIYIYLYTYIRIICIHIIICCISIHTYVVSICICTVWRRMIHSPENKNGWNYAGRWPKIRWVATWRCLTNPLHRLFMAFDGPCPFMACRSLVQLDSSMCFYPKKKHWLREQSLYLHEDCQESSRI